MTRSTLGFVFSPDLSQVMLITKQRPDFHKGKLNGLGGKCEPREAFLKCIQREVEEEAGLTIIDWKAVGELTWQNWKVKVFTAIYSGPLSDAKSLTSDPVAWYPVKNLPHNIITNLTWLVPLCADILRTGQKILVKIKYG